MPHMKCAIILLMTCNNQLLTWNSTQQSTIIFLSNLESMVTLGITIAEQDACWLFFFDVVEFRKKLDNQHRSHICNNAGALVLANDYRHSRYKNQIFDLLIKH